MQKVKRLCRNRTGFTLIELMIALLVVTLVIVGYIGANVVAQKNSEEMHERTLAVQDANRAIEHMRDISRTGTFPGNVVTHFPQNQSIPELSSTTCVTGEISSSLKCEQVVVTYANALVNPLDVTITVTWVSYTGRQHTETVRTYITQR